MCEPDSDVSDPRTEGGMQRPWEQALIGFRLGGSELGLGGEPSQLGVCDGRTDEEEERESGGRGEAERDKKKENGK